MDIKPKIREYKLQLIAIIGFIFALISVFGRSEPPTKALYKSPPATPFVKSIAGIGIIEPKSEIVSIGTEIPGVIRKIYVKVGDKIKSGTDLFSIDQRDIDAQINILKASLTSAKIQYTQANEQFLLVKNLENQPSISKEEFITRKFNRDKALANLKEITYQLEQLKTTKNRMTVKAPFDSEILELNIRTGEYVNNSSPIIKLGDTSSIHLRVEIDEENASYIKKNNKAIGYPRGATDKTIALKFVRFEPLVKPKQNLTVAGQRVDTRVVQVIYQVLENSDSIFIGQQMDIFIEDK